MNFSKDMIEKLIKLNNEECPEFAFSNPLLDRNVTRAISKSMVKTLFKSDENGKNKNVRMSILQTIRDLCKTTPAGHTVDINDDLTEVLTSFYEKQFTKLTKYKNNIDKQLDAFLIRNSKATINLNTSFKSNINPEILQAMLNLSKDMVFSDNISEGVVHWNLDDQKFRTVLQNLWDAECHEPYFYDNVSIQMKSKIESVILEISHKLLENGYNESLLECELRSLANVCSLSAECFQICTSILNALFKKTNFNASIENLIFVFIKNVKLNTSKSKVTIAILYPCYLSNIVTLLDCNLDDLSNSIKQNYIELANSYLKNLYENSEDDLIMLLSHFPLWFNIFFDHYIEVFFG